MLNLTKHPSFVPLGGACAAALLLAVGAPAFGQETMEEFTVIGQSKQVDVRRISASVNYQDLDLTTQDGRRQLKQRVWRTASQLCARLGEPEQAVGMAFACQDDAFDSAAPMLRAAVNQARRQVADGAPATSVTLVAAATPAR